MTDETKLETDGKGPSLSEKGLVYIYKFGTDNQLRYLDADGNDYAVEQDIDGNIRRLDTGEIVANYQEGK